MSLSRYIPGMQSGWTARNVVVGLTYLFFVTVVLPVLVRSYRPIRGC